MKRTVRLLCAVVALACLLCACNTGNAPTTKPTAPTPSTTPLPQLADPYRPFPVLPEKKVTDTPGADDLLLAENGVPNATIVVANTGKARNAANDLNSYLKRIVGVAFPQVNESDALPEGNLILVGPTQKTFQLGVKALTGYPESEKFYIGTEENCLILYGNDDGDYKGTQNAVTRFLEEAGCGWYANEEVWQVVPQHETLAVKDWDQTIAPLFYSRTLGHISSMLTNRWMLGGDSHNYGHGLQWLVGKGQYANHPLWYAQIDGVRSAPTGWYQFCYTNEALAQFVANKVISQFDRYPNLTNYTIAANDGWDKGWCECEVCAEAGNHTDQVLVLANRVAEEVAKVYPDKTVSILAYHETFLPPVKTVAHPNVEVMFCTETNPMADFSVDYPIHLGKNGTTQVVYTQSWQASCKQYIEDAQLQNVAIWSWFCVSGEDQDWAISPWVQGNITTRIFQLYKQMGVTRIFADCGGENDAYRWPVFYVYARSMWDDVVDGETLLYDACKKLYGDGADEMFLYYRLISDATAVCVSDDGITWVPPSLYNVYGPNLTAIREAVTAAWTKVGKGTEEENYRMERHLRAWAYVEQMK